MLRFPFFCLLLTLSVFVWSESATAQSAEDRLLEQLSTQQSTDNQVRIEQQGAAHEVYIQQAGTRHQLSTDQQGEQHFIELTQQGFDNQYVIEQTGRGHSLTGIVEGNSNQIRIEQAGRHNTITQDLAGDNMNYAIRQEGSFLELHQVEHDPLAPAYEVHQRGQDMQITIEQGFVGIPAPK